MGAKAVRSYSVEFVLSRTDEARRGYSERGFQHAQDDGVTKARAEVAGTGDTVFLR